MTYIPPDIEKNAFTCPHCDICAQQLICEYKDAAGYFKVIVGGSAQHTISKPPAIISSAFCANCNEFSLWIDGRMIYPVQRIAPQPNPDMPEAVLTLYEEAASISTRSPRAAAALLRLCVQLLCKELGEPGKNIDKDIGSLVKKGLSQQIQQALDTVRVVGNDAVHPGVIDVDEPAVAEDLFRLLNMIVDRMISEPKRVSELYASLPETKREGIEKRDEAK